MKKEYYFVVSIFSKERNMKEKMLGEWLSSFKDSLFEFNEEFTPDDLQTLLRKRLNEINVSNRRSKDIHLTNHKVMKVMKNEIIFWFESEFGSVSPSAIMTLRLVRRWL